MTRRLAPALALAAVLLGGCAAPAPSSAAAASAAGGVPAAAVAAPVTVTIPAIGEVSPPIVPLGLNPDRTVAVPPLAHPEVVGWFDRSARPGERGPAVLLAHVDANRVPGAFYRLHELAAGAAVIVGRADGSSVRFTVTRVDTVPKTAFPTGAVYGPTPGPTLRLVTCGGPLDRAAHNYLDSVIVYATANA